MSRRVFHSIKDQGLWGTYAASLLTDSTPSTEFREQFGTFWIEAGHHIRQQIANDRVLVSLLRRLLPQYGGGALELFRGENRNRWERGMVGLAWTSDSNTAKMFGRGLNAMRYGGVLLKVRAEPAAIISGPNGHSHYLGETQFTLDPFLLRSVEVVTFFPAIE